MRKIRVLRIAFNDLGHGGIQSRILVVAEKLKDEIDEDIIVFTSKPAYYDKDFLKYGRIFRCPNYEGNNLLRKKVDYYIRYYRIKRNVLKIINEYGPYDVVHSHTFFEAAPCMAAAKKAGVPVRIAHSHNTGMPDNHNIVVRQINRLYRYIYRQIILKNSTERIGCSQAASDYLFGKNNGYAIHNCVNCEPFRPNKFPSKNWNELRLIHIGNFLPQKNQLFLIDVFYHLLKMKHDCHLIMIGRFTRYKDEVCKKIQDLGIEDKVEILPHDTPIPKALSQADYFVFPSNFEGFGNVMLEAQAAGLHCFASLAVPKEVDCGLVSFLSLDLNAEDWAKIILDFYEENGAKKEIVDMSHFTEDIFAKKFLELYRKSVRK